MTYAEKGSPLTVAGAAPDSAHAPKYDRPLKASPVSLLAFELATQKTVTPYVDPREINNSICSSATIEVIQKPIHRL